MIELADIVEENIRQTYSIEETDKSERAAWKIVFNDTTELYNLWVVLDTFKYDFDGMVKYSYTILACPHWMLGDGKVTDQIILAELDRIMGLVLNDLMMLHFSEKSSEWYQRLFVPSKSSSLTITGDYIS